MQSMELRCAKRANAIPGKRISQVSFCARALGALCLGAILLIVMTSGNLALPFYYSESAGHGSVNHIKILAWTAFFGEPFNNSVFRMCPGVPCEILNDRKELSTSKAILFHPRDINPLDLPGRRLLRTHHVFFLKESPYHVNLLLTPRDFFTLTMTYRIDSDVYMPYGAFRGIVKPRDQSSWAKFLRETVFKKRFLVAAFISNCHPPSARDIYVRALQQYVTVDVYGSCGPWKCPRSEHESCLNMLRREYKFFLAFENSVCKDYITEKPFQSLAYNVVPVVLNRRIAEPFLPNGSFIAADDFASPKELARYLLQLDNDMGKYVKYFDWLKSHEVVGYEESQSLAFCKLCHLLMDAPQGAVSPSESAKDIVKWFRDEGRCLGDYGIKISGIPFLQKGWTRSPLRILQSFRRRMPIKM